MADFQTGKEYELSPDEALRLCSKGYVLKRTDGTEHHKGEPSIRKYQLLGKWEKH